MGSLWRETAQLPQFAPLQGDIHTDVLIIGGGMAGLLCAHMLKQEGVACVVAEAGRICGGVTGDTTAKVTSQHGLIYHKLLTTQGAERAKGYLEANEEAVGYLRTLSQQFPCNFEDKTSYVYSLESRKRLEQEVSALQRLGFPAELVEQLPLPVPALGGVRYPGQGQFHPLRFAAGLAQGLDIYEHTVVRELMGTTARTDQGRIRAKSVIVATHFPFLNKHGSYFLKLYQHRSYVLALEGIQPPPGMYVDEAKVGLSFRSFGPLLLLGGGDHRTGKPGGGWRALRAWAREHYPTAVERYHWATQDCMSLDAVPYIGPYSARTTGLYVATGFQKWGMSGSVVAARLLCDQVLGRENPYSFVFSPSRSMLHPQLLWNGMEAVGSLLFPTTRRCPHMGCALKWNPQEHSWDCPCHGSRFTEEGRLLDNPATGDLPGADTL